MLVNKHSFQQYINSYLSLRITSLMDIQIEIEANTQTNNRPSRTSNPFNFELIRIEKDNDDTDTIPQNQKH